MAPLMYAAREGRVKVVKRLIELKVEFDKQDTRGYSVGSATNTDPRACVRGACVCEEM